MQVNCGRWSSRAGECALLFLARLRAAGDYTIARRARDRHTETGAERRASAQHLNLRLPAARAAAAPLTKTRPGRKRGRGCSSRWTCDFAASGERRATRPLARRWTRRGQANVSGTNLSSRPPSSVRLRFGRAPARAPSGRRRGAPSARCCCCCCAASCGRLAIALGRPDWLLAQASSSQRALLLPNTGERRHKTSTSQLARSHEVLWH